MNQLLDFNMYSDLFLEHTGLTGSFLPLSPNPNGSPCLVLTSDFRFSDPREKLAASLVLGQFRSPVFVVHVK